MREDTSQNQHLPASKMKSATILQKQLLKQKAMEIYAQEKNGRSKFCLVTWIQWDIFDSATKTMKEEVKAQISCKDEKCERVHTE